MIYEYHDHTNVGIINGSRPTYADWDSVWEDKNGKLVCIRFKGRWYDNVLEVLKDKKNDGYMACKRAYNRHKAEIEKKIGIYKEPKKKEIEMVKVLYYDYGNIDIAVVKKGAISIGCHKRPHQTSWTEEKQKWADEYNNNEVEHRRIQRELYDKIFAMENKSE